MFNIHQHLKDRHLNVELHRPIVDEVEHCASFILWNLSGQLVGYQQYRPLSNKKPFNDPKESKYFTYIKQPTVTVWGLESFYISNGPIFITEGLFDAARLTNKNQTAFAMLCGNPPKDYYNWLHSLNRPIVAVCDNDPEGKKLAKFANYFEISQGSKDLGDSSDDYVNWLISKYE